MDPVACLQRYVDAFNDGDHDAWTYALDDLEQWIRKGGFVDKNLALRMLDCLGFRSFQAERRNEQ